MSYRVKEVHVEYKENKITQLAVLWEENDLGWVRASYSSLKIACGYDNLRPDEQLSMDLVQRVAGSGANLPDELKKVYFPGERKWGR
jgi:hypothetical protein